MTRIGSSFVRPVSASITRAVVSTVAKTVQDVFVQGTQQQNGGGSSGAVWTGINQRSPGGDLPAGYLGSSFCAPTAVAMVLKAFGVAPSGMSNADLIMSLASAQQLSTTTNGTAATELPAVLEGYGLDDTQTRYAGDFTYANWSRLDAAGREALVADSYRVLGETPNPNESASAVLDRARFANAQGIIEGAVAGGQAVIINGAFGVLHPNDAAATGHYVVVTSVNRDDQGNVTGYVIMDPWTGAPATVDPATMQRFMEGNSICQLTVVGPGEAAPAQPETMS